MDAVIDFKHIIREIAKKRNEGVEFFKGKMLESIGMTFEEFEKSSFEFETVNYSTYSVIAIKLHHQIVMSYLIREDISYTGNSVRISIKAEPILKHEGDDYCEVYESTICNATESAKCRRSER